MVVEKVSLVDYQIVKDRIVTKVVNPKTTQIMDRPHTFVSDLAVVYDIEMFNTMKLNYHHIQYVLDMLRSNTTKVRNIKKYILASLFNAPTTIESYYRAEVNHDFPQYAAAK